MIVRLLLLSYVSFPEGTEHAEFLRILKISNSTDSMFLHATLTCMRLIARTQSVTPVGFISNLLPYIRLSS